MDPKSSLESKAQNMSQNWHDKKLDEAIAELAAKPATGLTLGEVQERQKRYGFNELREKPLPTFWERNAGKLIYHH